MKKNNRIIFLIYTFIILLSSNVVLAASTQSCLDCGGTYIPYALSSFSRNLISLIQIGVPIIIIITGMIELLRAVIASDEKKMDEVKPKIVRKIIIGVVIFLVFAIVKFVFSNFLGKSNTFSALRCANYFISEEGPKIDCPTREGYQNGTASKVCGENGDCSGCTNSKTKAACESAEANKTTTHKSESAEANKTTTHKSKSGTLHGGSGRGF